MGIASHHSLLMPEQLIALTSYPLPAFLFGENFFVAYRATWPIK